jgi:hypothetical protein
VSAFSRFCIGQHVQNKLGAGRDLHFVEDAEKVVLYGVLAQIQDHGDFTVGHSSDHQTSHFLLTLAENGGEFEFADSSRSGHHQSFDNVFDAAIADPDLALVDAANTFDQIRTGAVVAAENPLCSLAEGFDYHFAFVVVEKNHDAARGTKNPEFLEGGQTSGRAVIETSADQGDIRLACADHCDQFLGASGVAEHPDSAIPANGIGEQLAIDAARVSDYKSNYTPGLGGLVWHGKSVETPVEAG